MPQSLSNVLLHVVFSTKNRHPFLEDRELRNELNGVFIGILRKIHCDSLCVESVADHIHCLCQLSRTVTIARLVEEMKTKTSVWLKTQAEYLENFYWQSGYGAFSVSPENVPAVKQYIKNQEEHHRSESIQDEFRRLLRQHRIEFDERYVWD